jgi:hypothetical protein
VAIELTRRNLEILLAKLDDPDSVRMIVKEDRIGRVVVRAVENEAHYEAEGREPGPMLLHGQVV